MKILLTNTSSISPASNSNIEVTADLARPDLVIEEIIYEKGVDYILNAISEEAILNYINKAIAA